VVVDTAPVLAVADALSISRLADGVILVARSGRTDLAPLQQALATLSQVGASVVGLVLNDVKPRDTMNDDYTYGSDYGNRSVPARQPSPSPRSTPSTSVAS
jgi:Mrp family chromosome partitioning ATPase